MGGVCYKKQISQVIFPDKTLIFKYSDQALEKCLLFKFCDKVGVKSLALCALEFWDESP